MSSLIVEICQVGKIELHPNADQMVICNIKGWKTCIKKNKDGTTQFNEGDLCIFFPPDAILPKKLSDKLEVTKYLKQLARNPDGTTPTEGRVVVSRLRGQPSYGFISDLKVLPPSTGADYAVDGSWYSMGRDWEVGDDVADVLNITKWEPPISCTDGDAERPHPAFHRYFDLENFRNFPDLIPEGEPVVFTEKIHGKNGRVGYIRDTADDGSMIMKWMAGSNDVRRKEFVTRKRKTVDPVTKELKIEEYQAQSQFWQALDKYGIRTMILEISAGQHDVVVFGEIFGSDVQDMTYGMSKGQWDFRVFDITVDGKYLSVEDKTRFCLRFDVPMVPFLYEGPFSKAKVEEYVTGFTTICDAEKAGPFKGREGIVITTKEEKSITTEKKVFNRMALKAINFDYLERKGGSEFH